MASISGDNFGGNQIGNQYNYNKSKPDSRAIAEWLSPLNSAQKQKDVYKPEYWGSKQAFFELTEFQSWKDGQIDLLWCHGIAGSGKTVLVSMIHEYLRSIQSPSEKVGVACLYCEYQQQHVQTPKSMLASLWQQLHAGSNSESVPAMIENLHRLSMKEGTQLNLSQIKSVLQSTIDDLDHAFLLIDALDECLDAAKQETILGIIMAIATESKMEKRKVSVLVTSRISDNLFDATSIEIRATEQEIRSMVRNRVAIPESFKRGSVRESVAKSSGLRTKIIERIASKTDGMFLIADLMLRSLASAISIRDLNKTLDNMPQTLDEYYDAAWSRIMDQESRLKQLALHTISWLYLGKRDLKIDELHHALVVELHDKAFDTDSLVDIQTILEACQGLVVEEGNSQSARLMHLTIRDYLHSRYERLLPDASVYVAKICLTYLCFDVFHQDSYGAKYLEEYPFLDYASENWGFHAKGDSENSCLELITHFLNAEHCLKNAHMVYPQVFNPSNRCRVSEGFRDLFPLRVAVSFGLELTARRIIKPSAMAVRKIPQETQITLALLEAIENGFVSVVRGLLEIDVDPFPDSDSLMTIRDLTFMYKIDRPKTALDKSLFYGHKKITKLLLDWGSTKSSVPMRMNTNYAITAEDTETLRRFLGGKSQDDRMKYLQQILHTASARGKIKCIDFSLKRGVPVDFVDDFHDLERRCTALTLAVLHGKSEAVKLLLDAGANASYTYWYQPVDDEGCERSLLYDAVTSMRVFHKRLDFLLDSFALDYTFAGVDDDDIASFEDRLRVWATTDPRLLKLLDNPEFVEAIREDADHSKIISLLLDHGANILERGENDESLLHLSVISKRRVNAILQYLKHKPHEHLDINSRDSHGRTPLHYAAAACNPEVVEVLIDSGANVLLKDNYGATTLHFAMHSPRCVRIIIQHGHGTNDSPVHLGTPLSFAKSLDNHNEHSIRILESIEGEQPEANEEVKAGGKVFSSGENLPEIKSNIFIRISKWMSKQKQTQSILCRKSIAHRLRGSQQQDKMTEMTKTQRQGQGPGQGPGRVLVPLPQLHMHTHVINFGDQFTRITEVGDEY